MDITPITFSTSEEADIILANVISLEKRIKTIDGQLTVVLKRTKKAPGEMMKLANKIRNIRDLAAEQGSLLSDEDQRDIDLLQSQYNAKLKSLSEDYAKIANFNANKATIRS